MRQSPYKFKSFPGHLEEEAKEEEKVMAILLFHVYVHALPFIEYNLKNQKHKEQKIVDRSP